MNMKDLRLRSGKRAELVAVELDVGMSTVKKWDSMSNIPHMSPIGLKRLMDCYGCTFEELLTAEEEMRAAQKLKV